MNAVDHAHGGGRGKSKGNKHPRSIYGTLQHVRTRRPKDKDGNKAYVYSFLFLGGFPRHTDANICIVQCCYRTTKRKADSGQALDTHFFSLTDAFAIFLLDIWLAFFYRCDRWSGRFIMTLYIYIYKQ